MSWHHELFLQQMQLVNKFSKANSNLAFCSDTMSERSLELGGHFMKKITSVISSIVIWNCSCLM